MVFLQPWVTWAASSFMGRLCASHCPNTPASSFPAKATRTRAWPKTTATPPCTASRSLAPKTTPTSSHLLPPYTCPTSRKASHCSSRNTNTWTQSATFIKSKAWKQFFSLLVCRQPVCGWRRPQDVVLQLRSCGQGLQVLPVSHLFAASALQELLMHALFITLHVSETFTLRLELSFFVLFSMMISSWSFCSCPETVNWSPGAFFVPLLKFWGLMYKTWCRIDTKIFAYVQIRKCTYTEKYPDL